MRGLLPAGLAILIAAAAAAENASQPAAAPAAALSLAGTAAAAAAAAATTSQAAARDARQGPESVGANSGWIPLGRLFGGVPFVSGDGGDGVAVRRTSLEDVLGSLERSFGGARSHVMHLPSYLDDVLADVMEGGLSSALSARNVEFSFSPDRSRLMAKINMPAAGSGGGGGTGDAARRKLHISVVAGGARLRVKVETLSSASEMVFEHVVQLPVRVAQDGIETVANTDGSATATLRIVGELPEEGGGGGGERMRIIPMSGSALSKMLFGGGRGGASRGGDAAGFEDDEAGEDIVQTLPSAADVGACRSKYAGTEYRLLARHCVCKTSPTEESRALCFASVLSSAVKIARRLDRTDEATDAKHAAMECANHAAGHAQCLQAVATKFLDYIYGDVDAGERRQLSDRIRAAIESEDDGPSERPRSSLRAMLAVLALALVAMCCMLSGLRRAGRRLLAGDARRHGGTHGQMSSVLSQRAASVSGDERKRHPPPPRVEAGKLQ
jgi:hypothetical protein